MSDSQFVCQRCGVAVYSWSTATAGHATTFWKHAAGPNIKSCGKSPIVVERKAWNAELAQFVTDAADAVKRHQS